MPSPPAGLCKAASTPSQEKLKPLQQNFLKACRDPEAVIEVPRRGPAPGARGAEPEWWVDESHGAVAALQQQTCGELDSTCDTTKEGDELS